MTASRPTILVLGSFVVGLTIKTARLPVPGETLLGTELDVGPGGKGFNQALAINRLGGSVRLVLPVGNDRFADLARATIESENLADVCLILKPDAPCGVGFVTLLPDGENTILVAPGANALLTPGDLGDLDALLAGVTLVVSQMEIPIPVTQAVFAAARARGVRTMLNPAPGRPLPEALLAVCDVLTPNETEARLILGLPPGDPTPIEQLTGRLQGLGVNVIVVTRGSRGATVVTNTTTQDVPGHRVTPVDPTGAGDTFNAAFAVALVEGLSPANAARRACAAGALATQKLGVINALPMRAAVDQFLIEATR